jgi:hypothetical protein
MKKTYKDIILETVDYYSKNKRGTHLNAKIVDADGITISEESRCVYKTPDGAMCAVGRCLTEEYLEKAKDIPGDVYDLFEMSGLVKYKKNKLIVVNEEDIVLMLKEEYSDLNDIHFWRDIQHFHDQDANWLRDEEGQSLTELGKKNVNVLLLKYA